MTKYRIFWTEELLYSLDVDAESRDNALDKFHAGDYDFDEAKNTDDYLGILGTRTLDVSVPIFIHKIQ